jgi:hypothetical protein
MVDVEIVRILDAEDPEQILLAEFFGVVAQVGAHRAFRLVGELRLERIARDLVEAGRIGE